MYSVYYHRNIITNQYYIGITSQKPQERWRLNGTGYKSQKKIWDAIQKYGRNNFEHKILYTELTAEEAGLIEKRLIIQYNSIMNGYNVDKGGNIPCHSKETIEKIRQSMYGHYHTKETKEKITKIKQSQSGIQVICLETNKIYPSFGAAMRDTGIDKSSISKACHNKISSAGGYHWRLLTDKEDNSFKKDKRKKPVRCITTNKIYDSVAQAAKETNSDMSNICKVCNGKYKTTNKLQWEWYKGEGEE